MDQSQSFSSSYKQLVESLYQQMRETQEQINQISSQKPIPQDLLQQASKKIASLYEVNLVLSTLFPVLKTILGNLEDAPQQQQMNAQLLTLVSDLKDLWEAELMQQIQDKASSLLGKISSREEEIKKAISKRQQEIQNLAEQATARAKKAQIIKQ
jgi:gas vesicle protein